MKDFDKDDQNQTKDKTITIPSIEKEVLLMLCVLAATLDEYGAKDPHRRQGQLHSADSAVSGCAVQAAMSRTRAVLMGALPEGVRC